MDFTQNELCDTTSFELFEKHQNSYISNDINDSISTIFNETPMNFLERKEDENIQIKKEKKGRNKKPNLKFFICECGKVYRSKENAVLHYKNAHLKQKPYTCSFCPCGFSHRNGKIYHERKFHTKVFPYGCPFAKSLGCKGAFPTKSSLKYHLKSKHKENEIGCVYRDNINFVKKDN